MAEEPPPGRRRGRVPGKRPYEIVDVLAASLPDGSIPTRRSRSLNRGAAELALVKIPALMLPPIDAHAHIDVRIARARASSVLGAFVFAVTRSLDEVGGARQAGDDQMTLWGVGCHPAVPAAVDAFSEAGSRALSRAAAFVGEVGLDRRSRVPMDAQVEVLGEILRAVPARRRGQSRCTRPAPPAPSSTSSSSIRSRADPPLVARITRGDERARSARLLLLAERARGAVTQGDRPHSAGPGPDRDRLPTYPPVRSRRRSSRHLDT